MSNPGKNSVPPSGRAAHRRRPKRLLWAAVAAAGALGLATAAQVGAVNTGKAARPGTDRPGGAPVAATGLPASCTTPVSGVKVFEDDFEGTAPDFNWVKHRYDGPDANATITASRGPVLSGSQSGEFTVPGDRLSWRAEVANDAYGYGAYRFEFADYLPADWELSNFDTILAQWHGKPLSDGSNTNPPIALSVRNSTWLLNVFWLENPTDTTPQRATYQIAPVELGTWNKWTVDVDWSSPGHDGTVRVCLNGRELLTHRGENNYHQPAEPYFKAGIYRPSWNPAKGRDYPPGSVVKVYNDKFEITKLS